MLNKIFQNKVLFIYTPLTVYWILIFLLTTLPSNSLPSTSINDKVSHLLAYFFLSFLLTLALKSQNKFPVIKQRYLFFTIGICMFYGALDELHQLMVPGRFCDILDWTADSIGAVLGMLVAHFFILKKQLPA